MCPGHGHHSVDSLRAFDGCGYARSTGYYTSSYTLPQVFFGKDLIGGYEEIYGKRYSVHGHLPA